MEMLHAGAAVLHVRVAVVTVRYELMHGPGLLCISTYVRVAVVTVRYELMQSRPGPCRNQGRNQARESDESNIVTKI